MDELLKWCIDQKKNMQSVVEAMKSGRLKTHSNGVDDTGYWIEENERIIANLEEILSRHTVPGNRIKSLADDMPAGER